jgi:simple sugar transport system ATP-binding protein
VSGETEKCPPADRELADLKAAPAGAEGSDEQERRTESPLLSVRHLTKTYGAVRALDDVSLDVFENEVLGVVGDNGAGKSTFISLLAGYVHPSGGELFFRGRQVHVTSPATSRQQLGIEVIYQDLALASDLTVWQNLYLGQELHRHHILLDRPAMRAQSNKILVSLGTKIHADDPVEALSGGERQLVAVARALLFDRDILLMDEPTAAVSAAKADDVLRLIEKLKERGKTVVLISHRLEDVLRVCDRVVVFVTGRLAYVRSTIGLDVGSLAHMMFQRTIGQADDAAAGSGASADTTRAEGPVDVR